MPYGSDPSLPNILFPDQPGLDDLTLGDLRSPEDIPDFRYVPLVLRGRLQYVKEYERAHVIAARAKRARRRPSGVAWISVPAPTGAAPVAQTTPMARA